jgi:hypothetical protein
LARPLLQHPPDVGNARHVSLQMLGQ